MMLFQIKRSTFGSHMSYVRHVDRRREEAEMWAWLGCFPGTETARAAPGCSGLQQAEEERKKRFLSLSCEASIVAA